MEAYLQAEVRARVTGIIQERCYQEGQTVRPGDLLFKIDPAPLQAVLDECKATVARAKAVLADAEDKAARYSSLVAKGAVSVREHKQAMAEEDRARAEYAAACRVSGAGPPESGIHQGGSAHLRPRAPRAGDGRGICQPERIHAPDHH